MRRVVITLGSCALLAACASGGDRQGTPADLGSPPASAQPPTIVVRSPQATDSPSAPRVVRVVASGLAVPWGVTFLPDGSALVGERDSTRVLLIPPGKQPREVGRITLATPNGEGGLLGLATSPSYTKDHTIYAYVSTASDNRVVALSYADGVLGEPRAILTGIPNGHNHDGGRLLFAPDGTLFVSTGESGQPDLAQDTGSLGGKVLHITADGDPAPDNPDPDSPIWSLGHRNIQGLAYDGQGRLWATEFGDSTWDELNLIEPARNYGWPLVEGKGDQPEYRNPFVQWATADASPSGLAYLGGSLWAGALRGQRLWQVPVTGSGVGTPVGWFVGDYGRMRSVAVAPNGHLWVTTSNRDGRGDPVAADDRIVEIAVD